MSFLSRRRRGSQRNYFTVIENNSAGEVFDPTITTSIPTSILWVSSDGYGAVTRGTTHDVSYTVPADGPRTWNIYCPAGLSYIRTFDMREDKIVRIDVSLLRSAWQMTAFTNSGLIMSLRDLPLGLTYAHFSSDPLITGDLSDLPLGLTVASFSSDPLITGDLSDLPLGLTDAYFYSDLLITGDLSDLPLGLTVASFYSDPLITGDLSDLPLGLTYAHFYSDLLITGDLSDLPLGLTYAHFSSDPLITAGNVSHLVSIREFRIYSMGWSSASVDIVLLSISNAIHVNVNHFTYATPSLEIGGTNAVPGGNASAATTDPMISPGSGNSDTDWQWDAGAGKHKALTGMAAIWIMRNNAGHAWTVTATGVA